MIIYDLEISNPIPEDGKPPIIGITYAKGWNFPASMGIACIGVYDYTADTYRVFGEYEMEDFQKLIDAHDVCVGFNNIKFDNAVLRTADINIDDRKSYDILFEIGRKTGNIKGCSLENVVQTNFPNAAGKNGKGALAPILWQQGYHTKVIDYCLNDVRLTKMLMDRILRFGELRNPIKSGEVIKIRRP